MYKIQKTMEVAASHQLALDYTSPCRNLHGHNYYITVYVQAAKLNKAGMVIDFVLLKRLVFDFLDHKNLNSLFDANPTAENLAHIISARINAERTVEDRERQVYCYRVDVEETKNNIATWEEDLCK